MFRVFILIVIYHITIYLFNEKKKHIIYLLVFIHFQGKGFPDINTRLFVKKLSCTLNIPILALVDANPFGIEIMCVYRFGSNVISFIHKYMYTL